MTPNLSLRVEFDCQYGTCVKVQRGLLWIAFSEYQWRRIREHVPRLMTADYSLKLSECKYVVNKLFPVNDVRYICFSKTYKNKEGALSDAYINFNPEEWQSFLNQLFEMDKIFTPKKLKSCPDCKRYPVTIHEVTKRTQNTRLDAEALQAVKDNNDATYNQEAHKCTYCGRHDMSCDGELCHCHKYNCRECEKDSFCKTCRALEVEVISTIPTF